MFNKFPESNDQLLRMISGIQRYTLLPGISENNIARRLQARGYSIQMYPNIDDYDILVERNGESIHLDVKDFYDPFYFAKHIYDEYEMKGIDTDIWFIVPNTRLEVFPAYIEQVKMYIKQKIGYKINLMSEQELYRKVGVLLV